jgi:hypothetical protein
MPWTKREFTVGILALCLIFSLAPLVQRSGRPAQSSPAQRWLFRTQPQSPSEQALWEAVKWRMRAQDTVIAERETLMESLGPAFSEHVDDDRWRREQMAQDRHGLLRRARALASRAAALARSSQEEYRAARLLAHLECELGQHRAELRQARKLRALAPFRAEAASALAQALQCNGFPPVSTHSGPN